MEPCNTERALLALLYPLGGLAALLFRNHSRIGIFMLTIPKFLPEPEKEPTTRAARAASRKAVTRESQVETYLTRRVKELGGEVRKVKWIGRNGAPDRVCFLPNKDGYDNLIWVELKAPGRKPAAHQYREHERMRRMGQRVEVVDSYEEIERILK